VDFPTKKRGHKNQKATNLKGVKNGKRGTGKQPGTTNHAQELQANDESGVDPSYPREGAIKKGLGRCHICIKDRLVAGVKGEPKKSSEAGKSKWVCEFFNRVADLSHRRSRGRKKDQDPMVPLEEDSTKSF